jgi:hypothetical protein
MIELLDAVVHAVKTVTPTTIAEAKQHYEESVLMHHLLLGDMDDPWLDRETLHSAAMVYQKGALARYDYELQTATPNKTRYSRDRMLVIRIGDAMQKFFRKRGMYGTVANLATAAIGHEITNTRIWLKQRAPLQKIASKKRKRTPCKKSRQRSKKFTDLETLTTCSISAAYCTRAERSCRGHAR